MKKVLIVAIVVLTACIMVFAQGQNKQKVAVYMAGTEPKGAQGSHKVVGGELTGALSKSARYSAIDRTDAIIAQLAKEQTYQRSGAVDDAQIKRLGAQFGVQFLCIVEISEMPGGFYLNVRMVNVETAEVVKTASDASDLNGMNEMMRVARSLAGELAGVAVAATQPSQQQVQQVSTPAVSSSSSGNSFTDTRDGKTYQTVKIGNLTWMAENLNYQTGNSVCYDNSESNCLYYGRLYDWNTAMKACPAGWRLPSRQDWDDLTAVVGGVLNKKGHWESAGKKLKSQSGWNGTNDYDFSALPGGHCRTNGTFDYAGSRGYWWSAMAHGSGNAYNRMMYSGYDYVGEFNFAKGNGFSVRCVR